MVARGRSSLAASWESVRRIRKRFARGASWVVFPELPEQKKEQGQEDTHLVSTQALALNCEAIYAIVELYGPNPVHILPLQKEAT